jgi:hypothetical protein
MQHMVEHGQERRGSYLQSLQRRLTRGRSENGATTLFRHARRPSPRHGRKGARAAVETLPQIPMQPAQRCRSTACPAHVLRSAATTTSVPFRLFLLCSTGSFPAAAAQQIQRIDPSPCVPFALSQKRQCCGPRSSKLQRTDMLTLAVFSSRLHSGSGRKAGM